MLVSEATEGEKEAFSSKGFIREDGLTDCPLAGDSQDHFSLAGCHVWEMAAQGIHWALIHLTQGVGRAAAPRPAHAWDVQHGVLITAGANLLCRDKMRVMWHSKHSCEGVFG